MVNDRKELGSLFSGKIAILDFTLEEIHAVEVVSRALQLEDRYISTLVSTQTTATEDGVNQILTKNLRLKAYAICR